MVTIARACEEAGTELPAQAQYVLTKEMAVAVGTSMGGMPHGIYIGNCMDAQRMGIPPPPPPVFKSFRGIGRSRLAGGKKPANKK